MTETHEVPNPGSKEAIKLGCTCPVMDNNHGKGAEGYGPDRFWYSGDCPVHIPKLEEGQAT